MGVLTAKCVARERYNETMYELKPIISLLIAVGLAFSGLIARSGIRRMDLSPEQRRRTKNMVIYALCILLGVGMAVTWAEELAAATIVASGFAVALVLLHKELVLNVMGWWVKTMGNAFRIGDRVRVGDVRGDVIDYGILTTTLMEVGTDADHGMRTGNLVTLPNAALLAEPLLNETRVLAFEWKEFTFSLLPDEDWREAESILSVAATEMVSNYRDEVVTQLSKMADQFAFHPIDVKPYVFLRSMPDGGIQLWVRVAVPTREIALMEDHLTRIFLKWRAVST